MLAAAIIVTSTPAAAADTNGTRLHSRLDEAMDHLTDSASHKTALGLVGTIIGIVASRIALEYGDRFSVKGRGLIGMFLAASEAVLWVSFGW